VLHASPGKRKVVMTALNKSWRHHLVAARRVMQLGTSEVKSLTLRSVKTSPMS
jgi:hypothetical protein